MKNLLRGLILGMLLGIVIGILLTEQRQAREEKAREKAFTNDPEIKEHLAWRERMIAMENLINNA